MTAPLHRAQRALLLPAAVALSLLACEGLPQPPVVEPGLADGGLPALDLGRPPRPQPDAGEVPTSRDPRFNSIIPNRGQLTGGTRLRLVGRDFVPDMQVRIGSQPCLDVTLESENHLRCATPPGQRPGPVAVEVRWPGPGRPAVLEEAFTYYVPVALDQVEPAAAPTTGGLRVVIRGEGLSDPTTVRFGDLRALRVEHVDDGQLVAVAPPHDPGVVAITVENANGQARLEDAFTYTEPLILSDLDPAYGSEDGGDLVRLRGVGLLSTSAVRFDGARAEVGESQLGRTRLPVTTPRGRPGLVSVNVENSNGTASLEDSFLYLPAADGPFDLLAAVPRRLPNRGGAPFILGGNGFEPGLEVTLDDEPVFCERLSGQALRCTAPAMPVGPVDVIVTQGEAQAVLPGGLRFFEPVELYDVEPPRGAVAGGAVVEIIGSGLRPGLSLRFDDAPLELISTSEDGQRALARIPPGLLGLVTLVAETQDARGILPEAFRYFQPRSRFGGIWGEPIDRAVNLTVLDLVTGAPIPAAFVQIDALEGEGRFVGETNLDGQATVSEPELRGPVRITAAAPGYEVYTFDRITHENVTAYLYPHQIDGGPGGQEPIVAPVLRGTLSGLDLLEKPLEPTLTLVAFIETTHSSVFNRTSLPPPDRAGVLIEDGPFEIRSRVGEIALVATAAYVPTDLLNSWRQGSRSYFDLRAAASPLSMGLQRFISAGAGQRIDGLAVTLDIPLDREVAVSLDNPSGGVRGAPDVYEARPVLAFGSEGYWALDSTGIGDSPQMLIPYLPRPRQLAPDITYEWVGVARTETWSPYAMTFYETDTLEDAVLVGPFVGTPEPISPEPGGALGPWRVVEWAVQPGLSGPIEPPDANIVSLVGPTGLPLWTWITPGPITSLQLPPLPAIIQPGGVTPGDMYLYIEPVIVRGFFDYGDFNYNHLRRRRAFASVTVPITD